MTITAEIVFFATRPIRVSGAQIAGLLRAFGVSEVSTASKPGAQPDWEEYQLGLSAEAKSIQSGAFEVVFTQDEETETYGTRLTVAESAALVDQHTKIFLSVYVSEVVTRVVQSVVREVPELVRGEYAPSDLSVLVAESDIFSDLEGSRGIFYGHSFFSISVFGYGYPKDVAACRDAVLALPIVAEIRGIIESIIGPVDVCLIWNS